MGSPIEQREIDAVALALCRQQMANEGTDRRSVKVEVFARSKEPQAMARAAIVAVRAWHYAPMWKKYDLAACPECGHRPDMYHRRVHCLGHIGQQYCPWNERNVRVTGRTNDEAAANWNRLVEEHSRINTEDSALAAIVGGRHA